MEKSRLKMTNEEAIKIIENEKLCVVTRDKGYCNGGTDCSTCNLVKPTYHIIDGFDKAIEALQEQDHRCDNCSNGENAGVRIYCLLHTSFHRLDEYCSEWEEE